jgi:hypothetical protein
LTLPSGTVEVAFDSGVLKSGERTAPVCELEIELKSGGPAALYDLALLLAEQAAVRPTTRTKAERGLELALDTRIAALGVSSWSSGDGSSSADGDAMYRASVCRSLPRPQSHLPCALSPSSMIACSSAGGTSNGLRWKSGTSCVCP